MVTAMSALTPEQIYKTARQLGDAAANGHDTYPCGFAWVNIKPARGDFVKWCKANGIGRPDSYSGGYTLSSYECCNFRGQNMDVKEDGCRAFADFLRGQGIKANVYTRID